MKKIYLLLIITSIISIYVSFKLVTSFYWQSILLADWSNAELKVRFDIIEKIDTKFPNITTASLPLDAMKMRYYIREGKTDTLLTLLNNSMKASPFMGVGENIIAQYYYNTGSYDSAYLFSKTAFEKIKNNQLHGSVLVSSLIMIDSLNKAMEIFDEIDLKTSAHYRLLLQSLMEARDTIYFKDYVDKSKEYIESEDSYKKYKQIAEVGYDDFYQSKGLEEMAKIDYEKGYTLLSVNKYIEAIKLNPGSFDSNYNLGIIYLKEYNDSIDIAKNYFYKSIKLKPESGEAFYYSGVTNYIIDPIENKDSVCYYMNKSIKLDYNDALLFSKKMKCIN